MAGNDWQRLSDRVQQRMRELGIADQADLIRATRLSPPTVKGILNGAPRSPTVRPKTYLQLDDGLQWERGSMAAVLAGGEPVAAPSAGGDVSSPGDDLADRVGSLEQEVEVLKAGLKQVQLVMAGALEAAAAPDSVAR